MSAYLSERHHPQFTALAPAEAQLVWNRITQRWPDDTRAVRQPPADGDELFDDCQLCGLDQVRVVLSVADLGNDTGRTVIEKLIGRPIIPWAASVEAKQDDPCDVCDGPAAQAARHRKQPPDTRIVLSVGPQPHTPGTLIHASYECWRVGDTVQQCRVRGVVRNGVRRDVLHGHVRLGAPR